MKIVFYTNSTVLMDHFRFSRWAAMDWQRFTCKARKESILLYSEFQFVEVVYIDLQWQSGWKLFTASGCVLYCNLNQKQQ